MKNRSFLFHLFLFCIVNFVIVNGLVYFVGKDDSQYKNISDIVQGKPTFYDSWDPMSMAVKVFREGSDPTIYQKVFFEQKQKFQYPPTSLLIVDLLRKLTGNFDQTYIIINWISVFALWGIFILSIFIGKETFSSEIQNEKFPKKLLFWFLLVLMGLTFYPINKAFQLGQIQVWLDFLFTLSLWFWIKDKRFNSGMSIGLISIIKPQMGLFLIWGILRKKWSFCLGIISVVVAGLCLSILRYGWAAHFKYIEVLQFIGQRGETFFSNQSVNGLLNRLLQNGNNLEWDASRFAPQNTTVTTITYITTGLFLLIGLFITLKKDNRNNLKASWISYSIAGIAFTIASPVAWEHHYGILFPMFVLAFPYVFQLREKWESGFIWTELSYLLIANQFLSFNLTSQTLFNITQSYLFFGVLIFLWVLIRVFNFSLSGNNQNPIPDPNQT
jgi:hypothetical protein